MKIHLKDVHSCAEASDALEALIRMLRDQYGVQNLGDIHLDLSLYDDEGQQLYLVDHLSGLPVDRIDVSVPGAGAEDFSSSAGIEEASMDADLEFFSSEPLDDESRHEAYSPELREQRVLH